MDKLFLKCMLINFKQTNKCDKKKSIIDNIKKSNLINFYCDS